jgi:hypothetical protein
MGTMPPDPGRRGMMRGGALALSLTQDNLTPLPPRLF